MRIDSDDFELFGLARGFALDPAELDSRWRALQGQVHPDRFAAEGAAAQRLAMQWAVRVNEAYRRLKDPLQRAAYLCGLEGAPIDAENNTAMPTEFLVQQMEWREALADAKSADQIEALAREVEIHRAAALQVLAELLDHERRFAAAAGRVTALMFVERFAKDIEQRLESFEP